MGQCAASDCSGNEKISTITRPQDVSLPAEMWRGKGDKTLLLCGYCGFLWFAEPSDRPPFTRRFALGFYDNAILGSGFKAVPSHPLKRL
jgi:hypothetical protein